MRVFWSLMLVLFALSMAVLALPSGHNRAPTRGEQARIVREPATLEAPARPAPVPADTGSDSAAPIVNAQPSTPEVEPALPEADTAPVTTAAPDPEFEQTPDQTEAGVIDSESAEPAATHDDVTTPTPDPFAAAAEAYLLRSREGSTTTENDDAASTVAATEPTNESLAPADALDETEAASAQTAKAEDTKSDAAIVRADGSLKIGDTVVTGDGTDARPFELTWPLLTSVARVYKPEQGKEQLPAWLDAIEGKRIRLTGHVVLPLVATSTEELLLTMNPWDGCCVGVPPTAYDALEVTTSEPVRMQGASVYGSVEGTFRTDPYLAGGWLLGLYLLDDARVVE